MAAHKPKPTDKRLSDAELVARYEAGESPADLAATSGFNRSTIRSRLRKLCVQIRGHKQAAATPRAKLPKLRPKALKPLPIEEVIARYEKGESPEHIAAAFGTTRPTIAARLRRLGVRMRERSEAARLRAIAIGHARLSEAGKRAASKRTLEDKQERLRRIKAAMTPEQKREAHRRSAAARSWEERSETAKRFHAKRTPEERSAPIRKIQAARTPEQRRAIGCKAAKLRMELYPVSPLCNVCRTKEKWPGRTMCRRCASDQSTMRVLGLSPKLYRTIFPLNEARHCFLCDRNDSNAKIGIDHDHQTHIIRGPACSYCNFLIGAFEAQAIKSKSDLRNIAASLELLPTYEQGFVKWLQRALRWIAGDNMQIVPDRKPHPRERWKPKTSRFQTAGQPGT